MSIVVDLEALAGPDGLTVLGDASFDSAGYSVSAAGDVNGDGFDDVIIGAPFNDSGGAQAGRAYVIFGRPGGLGTIDLGNLQAADGFALQGGGNRGDLAGLSVSGAGDVNGDGFDDIIVGTTGVYFYSANPTAYVIFGKPSGFGTIDLPNLQPSNGFGLGVGWQYGYGDISVAAAGDVNGDGFDDVIIGSPYDMNSAGAAFVVLGRANGFEAIQLNNPAAAAAGSFAIRGVPGSRAGASVSGAGDVNGDGFDDLIVGAYLSDAGGYNAGQAYVIFGKSDGFGTIQLGSLSPASGFVIQGAAVDDWAGFSVSAAGDVNGDGFDDLIIGAPLNASGGLAAGEAYVIFGKVSGFGSTIDLSNLAPGSGFVVRGDDAGDRAGWSVSAAGDVNRDGFDDIIVGAPSNDNRRNGDPLIDAGEAYIIFGRASGFGMIDLTHLSPADGFILQGEAAGDQAGLSISGAGDVDGDGFADLIIGAPFNDQGGANAGAAFVVLSNEPRSLAEIKDDFNGDGRSDVLWRHDTGAFSAWQGRVNGAFVSNPNSNTVIANSWDVAGTGDFDGDGRDDVLWRHDSGAFSAWRGTGNGGFIASPNSNSSIATSWHVAATGDFNGDGRDDVAWRHDSGLFSVWHGRSNGGFVASANSNSSFATSWHVAGTGDFNGDGRDDVAWRNDNGAFLTWHGQANGGFVTSADSNSSVAASWYVVGTGDFNGDGRDDVAWRHDSGAFSVWHGQANGGFVASGNSNTTIATSWHVAGTGDYNGDGRDDVLWRNDSGAFSASHGQSNGGFVANPNSNTVIDPSWHVQSPDILFV